jgi:hypothetical protein
MEIRKAQQRLYEQFNKLQSNPMKLTLTIPALLLLSIATFAVAG